MSQKKKRKEKKKRSVFTGTKSDGQYTCRSLLSAPNQALAIWPQAVYGGGILGSVVGGIGRGRSPEGRAENETALLSSVNEGAIKAAVGGGACGNVVLCVARKLAGSLSASSDLLALVLEGVAELVEPVVSRDGAGGSEHGESGSGEFHSGQAGERKRLCVGGRRRKQSIEMDGLISSSRRGGSGGGFSFGYGFFFTLEARDGVLCRARCCRQRQRFVWARMGLHVCAIAHEALRLISQTRGGGGGGGLADQHEEAAFGARLAELDRRAFGRSANLFLQPRLAPQLAWTVGCKFNFRHLPKQSASARPNPAHVHRCTARSLRGTAPSALCPSLAQVRPCDTLAHGSLSLRTETRASAAPQRATCDP